MLATLATLLTMVITGATNAASADPSCTYYLGGLGHLHNRYSIGDSHPTATVGGYCTYADNWGADITVHHATGSQGYVSGSSMYFDGCSSDFTYYDYEGNDCFDMDSLDGYESQYQQRFNITQPGRMMTYGSYTFAEDCCDTYYSTTISRQYFTAKYATRANLSAARDGSRVTFTVQPEHYSNSYHGFVGSGSTQIIVERYTSGAWHRYRAVTTYPNSGIRTITVSQSAHYSYRAFVPETGTRWSHYSTVHSV